MQYRAHVAQSGSPRAPVTTAVFSKRQNEVGGWRPCLLLTAITSITCVTIYFLLGPLFSSTSAGNNAVASSFSKFLETEKEPSACCRGVEHQELWGNAVKWGSDHKHNTSEGCCQACKALCTGDGPCICNSWVYCSSPEKCGDRFGECWLKKQDDPLAPAIQDSNAEVMWTSGLVYGKEMGIIALETEYGAIRIKLLPECAPLSVAFMLEALKFRHCAGCQFYRAEGRGTIWDRQGNRGDKRQTGPPYALLQGTLEGQGIGFKEIPREACLGVKRGMMGWIGGGPDFFISLANHDEWAHKYTIFAYVLPEDISVVEKLVSLPTTPASWSGVKVSVLKDYISIKVKKIEALLLNQMAPADPLSQMSTIKASKLEEKKPLQIPHVKMPAT